MWCGVREMGLVGLRIRFGSVYINPGAHIRIDHLPFYLSRDNPPTPRSDDWNTTADRRPPSFHHPNHLALNIRADARYGNPDTRARRHRRGDLQHLLRAPRVRLQRSIPTLPPQ
jgi:hypothetical protein